MKFHCDSVKLTVKKAVGRGIECAEAHSWQNKSFLKKKPSLTRTKVKKAVGGGGECAAAHSWQNKSFLKKNLGSQERRSEKVVGGGIECAAAHSWQNKRFLKKKPSLIRTKVKKSCRGRGRTSTRQLASTQSLVVNPGRPDGRLYAVFIPYSSPSRQEGMSAKNFITPQY